MSLFFFKLNNAGNLFSTLKYGGPIYDCIVKKTSLDYFIKHVPC